MEQANTKKKRGRKIIHKTLVYSDSVGQNSLNEIGKKLAKRRKQRDYQLKMKVSAKFSSQEEKEAYLKKLDRQFDFCLQNFGVPEYYRMLTILADKRAVSDMSLKKVIQIQKEVRERCHKLCEFLNIPIQWKENQIILEKTETNIEYYYTEKTHFDDDPPEVYKEEILKLKSLGQKLDEQLNMSIKNLKRFEAQLDRLMNHISD